MQSATPSLFGRITAVQHDHRTLMSMLGRLRDYVVALKKRDVETVVERLTLVEEFAEQLRAHFAAEEADGYFGALVSDRPSLRPHVEVLRADHDGLVVAVLEIVRVGTEGVSARDLAVKLGEFLESLQSHERRENLLVQDYLLKDEGAPGD